MQLSVPDPSVRDQGREEITVIDITITMPDGSQQQTKVIFQESRLQYVFDLSSLKLWKDSGAHLDLCFDLCAAQMDQGQTIQYVRAFLHEHFGVPFTGSVSSSPSACYIFAPFLLDKLY